MSAILELTDNYSWGTPALFKPICVIAGEYLATGEKDPISGSVPWTANSKTSDSASICCFHDRLPSIELSAGF
jgi:hypothetical protein